MQACEPHQLLAPVLAANTLERGAKSLQLHDLGVAEVAQQQLGAVLPEQEDRRSDGEREHADQQQRQAAEQRRRP